jgi:hypothetical protein
MLRKPYFLKGKNIGSFWHFCHSLDGKAIKIRKIGIG